MESEVRPKFSVCAFFKYLIGSILTFLAPIILSLLLSAIASWAQSEDRSFRELFRAHVFDQILPSVLSLLILVLVSHFLFCSKANTNLSIGWSKVLKYAAIACLLFAMALFVVSTLYAAKVRYLYFQDNYKYFVGIELIGAALGIIVQCMHHTDAYVVI